MRAAPSRKCGDQNDQESCALWTASGSTLIPILTGGEVAKMPANWVDSIKQDAYSQMKAYSLKHQSDFCYKWVGTKALLMQSAADPTPQAPSSTRQGRGVQVLLHIASANFCALTSLFTEQLTSSLEHELKIPSQLKVCKSVGLTASWNGPKVDCGVPGTGHSQAPDPARASTKFCPLHWKPSKRGIPDKIFAWSCMLTFRADGRLADSGQALPSKIIQQICTVPATASHTPLTLQGCLNCSLGGWPKLQVKGCAGWAWMAGVSSTRKQANLGAHAP
eukprot:1142642-Pelagomonas_calceolata.AAC.8